MSRSDGELHACSLAELEQKGCLVAEGPVPIAVFFDKGKLFAVDNRCPHMGFPLHRGTVDNGVLTCHWHHARFDAQSGCTFDLFADDVAAYPVEARDGEVYIQTQGVASDPVAVGQQRLLEGMQQNIRLVIAKAVVKLVNAGVSTGDIARQGGLFATLAESLLREDGEFHSFQMLEAAIRQFDEQDGQEQKWLMLVAAARYLAAHAPTQRELLQTQRIALRLHRGEPVYEAE